MSAIQQVLLAYGAAGGGGGNSHRYWRLYITALNGSAYAALAELDLHESIGGADTTGSAPGSGSASSAFDAFSVATRAFDNNTATLWASNGGALPQWLKWDYGLGEAKEIIEFVLKARPDGSAATQSPKDFKLQWSDDDSAWTDAITVTNQTGWSASEVRTFS